MSGKKTFQISRHIHDIHTFPWSTFFNIWTQMQLSFISRTILLKEYSEINWLEVHFSPHNYTNFWFGLFCFVCLHILKDLSCTNLRSRETMQFWQNRQVCFVNVWISDAWASEITVQYSMEKYNLCYIALYCKIIPTGILNIRFFIEIYQSHLSVDKGNSGSRNVHK